MTEAKWLLKHHREHMSRIATLTSLQHALQRWEKTTDRDELIEELSLARQPFTGLPRTKAGKASKTEYVVFSIAQEVQLIQEATSEQLVQIDCEIARMRTYVAIYESALTALTKQERKLARLIYEDGYSITRIHSEARLKRVDGSQGYSYNTLYRLHRRILHKVQAVIQPWTWIMRKGDHVANTENYCLYAIKDDR